MTVMILLSVVLFVVLPENPAFGSEKSEEVTKYLEQFITENGASIGGEHAIWSDAAKRVRSGQAQDRLQDKFFESLERAGAFFSSS